MLLLCSKLLPMTTHLIQKNKPNQKTHLSLCRGIPKPMWCSSPLLLGFLCSCSAPLSLPSSHILILSISQTQQVDSWFNTFARVACTQDDLPGIWKCYLTFSRSAEMTSLHRGLTLPLLMTLLKSPFLYFSID